MKEQHELSTNSQTPDQQVLASVEVGEELHASIERDTEGNPVIVITAPIQLADRD